MGQAIPDRESVRFDSRIEPLILVNKRKAYRRPRMKREALLLYLSSILANESVSNPRKSAYLLKVSELSMILM